MPVDLTEACSHLRERRRMYVPDDRYASVVAFVTGFSYGRGGGVLDGFQRSRVRGGRVDPGAREVRR